MRYLLLLLLAQPAFGQTLVLDAPCAIYHSDAESSSSWCGVALSRSVILSCGHHGKTGEVRVEFPIGNYGSQDRVSLPARVLRSGGKRDLSVLQYDLPVWAEMREVKLGRVKGRPTIRGFLRGSNATREATLGRDGLEVDGFPVVEILATCEPGMSGSPLLEGDTLGGILIGSGGGVSHLVDPETIRRFLEE